jgi:peptidoglycan hydrolase CwlO-like protein
MEPEKKLKQYEKELAALEKKIAETFAKLKPLAELNNKMQNEKNILLVKIETLRELRE